MRVPTGGSHYISQAREPSRELLPPPGRLRKLTASEYMRMVDVGVLGEHERLELIGRVRSMAIYEGTVGSLLEEPPEVLWRRACERHLDPFVTQALCGPRTLEAWAAATRTLDLHFGALEEQPRLQRRASAR